MRERDEAVAVRGTRGESHTSQLAMEWWLRKVQMGQGRRRSEVVVGVGSAMGAGAS